MEQKFIRDAINIDDISGARPKKLHRLHKYERKTNYIEDIAGSRAKKEYCRGTILNPLDCKDINEFRIFKTNRITNPLQPTYDVQNEDNTKCEIGFVEGSRSRIRHPERPNKEGSLNLKCEDIEGCKTSTVGNQYIKNRSHLTYTNTNLTKDIPGAQISTLKKGIQTKRHLNPLVPQYQYLDNGHEEVKAAGAKSDAQVVPSSSQMKEVGGMSEPAVSGKNDLVPTNPKTVMFDSQDIGHTTDGPNLMSTQQYLADDFGGAKQDTGK